MSIIETCPPSISEKLKKHMTLQSKLSRIKKEEMEMRKEIIDFFGDQIGPFKGKLKVRLGAFEVNLSKNTAYKIDLDTFDEIIEGRVEELTKEELDLVKIKRELNKVVMNYLLKEKPDSEVLKSIYEEPSAPTIKYEDKEM